MPDQSEDFHRWIRRWEELGTYHDERMGAPGLSEEKDLAERIEGVLELLSLVPKFSPNLWTDIKKAGYRRRDGANPAHEHEMEAHLLGIKTAGIIGMQKGSLKSIFNAVPLVGSRKSAKSADLLGVASTDFGLCVVLLEMKKTDKNVWAAAVQNLLEIVLFREHLPHYQNMLGDGRFGIENDSIKQASSVWGYVVGPAKYFDQEGQKGISTGYALELLKAVKQPIHLARYHEGPAPSIAVFGGSLGVAQP